MLTQLRCLLPPPPHSCPLPAPAAAVLQCSSALRVGIQAAPALSSSNPNSGVAALSHQPQRACRHVQCFEAAARGHTDIFPDQQLQVGSPRDHEPDSSSSQPAVPLSTARGSSRRQRRGRLDEVCMALAPHLSRNVVQSFILQGKVTVDGRVVVKAGTPVSLTAHVHIAAEEPKYVCRAGHKLEAGLAAFGIDPSGLTCLDSGVSTGGFTDCLLQQGAAHVYGIDVAYGQVANKVRQDERVTLLERFNVRNLTPDNIPVKIDLATLDLSFISVLKVLPAVMSVMRGADAAQQGNNIDHQHQQQLPTPVARPQEEQQEGEQHPITEEGCHRPAQLVVLIKPQFEAGRAQVSSGGVVRDPQVHLNVLTRVTQGIEALGFGCQGIIESPLKGDKSGNTEFLGHYVRGMASRATEIPLLTIEGHLERANS